MIMAKKRKSSGGGKPNGIAVRAKPAEAVLDLGSGSQSAKGAGMDSVKQVSKTVKDFFGK